MNGARNLVVAQSGGPTPVINSSLQGILDGGPRRACGRAGFTGPGTASRAC